MKTNNHLIGKRIRKLRESWALSQQELAEVLGLRHAQSISDIERGDRALRAFELSILAGYFHTSIETILGLRTIQKPVVQWRALNDTSDVAKDEALFFQRCQNYRFIVDCTGSKTSQELPEKPLYEPHLTSYEDVMDWAHSYRKSLSLGDKPACALRDAIEEEWGVWVFSDDLATGSAACTKGDFGVGILLNSSEPGWRQNYSLGHELFHLITWGSEDHPKSWTEKMSSRNETLAEIFASSLLMPEECIRSDFHRLVSDDKIRWYDLMMLARSYDVSTIALLWRLANLKLIADDVPPAFFSSPELSAIDKNLERDDQYSELPFPSRYIALAYKAYNDGRISIGRLADLLETTVSGLRDELLLYGIDLNSDVYETTLSTP
ncbi:MAG: ImmA/IrrE family metallo-endopeptidase [Candidatus Aegiribacteria sp.]|nr:ImmA/IrrE family metallo-endopeptidase [Candidatus Aegiribacteria sp.]